MEFKKCICLKMTVIQVHSDIYWHGVFSMHFGALSLDLTNLLFLIFTLYSYVLKIALMQYVKTSVKIAKKTWNPFFIEKAKISLIQANFLRRASPTKVRLMVRKPLMENQAIGSVVIGKLSRVFHTFITTFAIESSMI